MEHAKLANGNGHQPIGHSSTSAPKKAARKKTESARPLQKEIRSKSKSEKLVCRYCGSDDLAPSFINGGIADAASVSLSAMGLRHGRGKRRSRSSLATTGKKGPSPKGLGPFRLKLYPGRG
jgi:hypothetical protein